jgi:hypothetical protein
MVRGMVLEPERHGPLAVARGNKATRLVTLRNLDWEPVTRRIKLDASIGFDAEGPVEVRRLHPGERILGTYRRGDEIEVEVLPFRACLLLVDAAGTGGVGVRGCNHEVVRDVPGKPTVIRLLGKPGTTAEVSLAAAGRVFREAELDGKREPGLTGGGAVRVEFPGEPDATPWHRRLGAPAPCAVPADAEALFESCCFAGDNDPLEIRSLRRSGPSAVPQVRKAREAFLEQPIIAELGMLPAYLLDGDPDTWCDLLRTRERAPASRILRVDLGRPTRIDHLLLDPPATGDPRHAVITPAHRAEVSADLATWTPARLAADGRGIRIESATETPVRFVRSNLVPDKLAEIRGFAAGRELARDGWRASWLFPSYRPAAKAWSLPVKLGHPPPGSYLAIACNGIHGRDGAWVALRVDGRWVGAPERAPSYPVSPWEYPVRQTDRNYSYFIPITPELVGKSCEVFVLALDPENANFTPDVWLTAHPVPLQSKMLTLAE